MLAVHAVKKVMSILILKESINDYKDNTRNKLGEKPKLQLVPPKDKPPPPREYGNYCVRSDVYIRQKNEGGRLLGKVSGMSPDWDIIPKTVNYCQTVKNGRVRHGHCTQPIVKVERWHDDCDGNVSVEVYDINTKGFDKS